jgi:hypothetical protein
MATTAIDVGAVAQLFPLEETDGHDQTKEK